MNVRSEVNLKKNVKTVNMFVFTVNGQEPRFDKGTRLLIKVFEQTFGAFFWEHMAVAYTRWGSSTEQLKNRKMSKIETRRDDECRFRLHKSLTIDRELTI